MSSILFIARVYANALFDVSMQQKNTEQWRLILKFFVKISSYELVKALFFRSLESEKISNVFIAICEDVQNKKLNILAKNFIRVIAEKNRLSLLPIIFKEFNYLYYMHYKCILRVEVFSARPLSQNQNDKITIIMARFFSKKHINIVNKIDSNICAGIIVRVGDVIIDGSLSGRMFHLKDHILQS